MSYELKELSNFNLPIVSNISPLSDDYPIVVLSNGVKKQIDTTNKIITSICEKTFAYEGVAKNLAQAAKGSVDYVLELSTEQKDMLEKGILKLSEENGRMFAQLKDGNHYGKKIPVVQKAIKGEVDYSQMANVMQFKALQEQIKALAEQVETIGENVKFVLKGQQNDRIALYYSGIHLFIEAQNISNESFKYQLMSQAFTGATKVTQKISSSSTKTYYVPSKLKTVNFDVKDSTAIPYGYLSGIGSIQNINISKDSTITTINDYALQNTGITELDLTDLSLNSLNALNGLSKLEYISLGSLPLTDELKSYISNIKKIDCGTNTEVPANYFENFTKLDTVYLGSVVTICNSAFNKSNVKYVSGKNVENVGNNAFYQTPNLETCDFENLKIVGAEAFKESNIQNININTCKEIGANAFQNSKLSGDIVLTNANLSSYAFANTNIKSLKLIGTKTKSYLANGCKYLESFETDQDIIDSYAFQNCTSLTNVDTSNLYPLEYSFANTALKEIVIQKPITQLENAFKGVTGTEKIHIYGLESIDLDSLFGSNIKSTLKELVIPDNFKNFVTDDLTGYTKLAGSVNGGLKYIQSQSGFNKICFGVDKTTASSINGNFTLDENCMKITKKAFYQDTYIKTLSCGESLTSLGESAFDASQITEISMPSVSELPIRCFYKCSKLTKITAPSVTKINFCVFYDNVLLSSIKFSDNISFINYDAFNNCAALTVNFDLPSLTYLGPNAFKKSGIKSFSASKLTSIPSNAFESSKVATVNIPAAKSIESYAFYDCNSLITVNAASLLSVETYAFADSSLTTINAISLTTIADYAFKSSKVSSVNGNASLSNVTTIGVEAFYGCNLSKIILSKNVTRVKKDAFKQNLYVTELNLGGLSLYTYGKGTDYIITTDYTFNLTDFLTTSTKLTTLVLNTDCHYIDNYQFSSVPLNYVSSSNTSQIGLKYLSGYDITNKTMITYYAFCGVQATSKVTDINIIYQCRVITGHALTKGNYWASTGTHKIHIPSTVQFINSYAIYNDPVFTGINFMDKFAGKRELSSYWVFNSPNRINESMITFNGSTPEGVLHIPNSGTSSKVSASVINNNIYRTMIWE